MARSNRYDTIYKYILQGRLTEPMHIGSGNGDKESILTHPVSGIPFIQASSIAGAFREQYERLYGQKEADAMFGKTELKERSNAADYGSRISISDGEFDKPIMEYRPHVTIDRKSGSAVGGSKFNMEYLSSGSLFTVTLYIYDDKDGVGSKKIMKVFEGIEGGGVQLGGSKSKGCGSFTIESLKLKIFDMRNSEDRQLWMREDDADIQYTPVRINEHNNKNIAYRIELFGKTESGILVKSISAAIGAKGSPDSSNIQNGKKEYILPATSIKGTIRSRAERIAAFLESMNKVEDADRLIHEIFGKSSDGDKQGIIGNAKFHDTVLTDGSPHITHRIHIDKFTGGVMDGGLFTEEEICADDLIIKIDINNANDPEKACALVLLVLRDVAIKSVNFGSGYNVGRGFINVDKIIISDADNRKAIIDPDSEKTEDPEGIVDAVLAALN